MGTRANVIWIAWVVAIGGQRALADGAGRHLEWDPATRVLIQRGGAYGRITRAGDGLVCCFERRGHVAVRRSTDEGRTWGDLVDVAGYPGGNAANPEVLALGKGRLLLFYNGRPRDGRSPYTIGMASSMDDGATWVARPQPLYSAGTTGGDGCYEPAAVRLPSGVIELFFANEHGHAADHTQEIDAMRSRDGGNTWSPAERVSYRPGGRDGMPVPMMATDDRSILLAIEDNGLARDHQLKPAIESLPLGPFKPIDGNDDRRRWGAVTDPPWPDRAYAGAPYLRQFPDGGPTVLACQPEVGGAQRIRVFVGDATAHHFGQPTEPFGHDPGYNAQWNALFIKSPTVVTAVTTGTVDGTAGVWAIDGRLAAK